ncbi:YSIRK-type signal peptide-containing protein [Lactobacillus gasseri]|nr:YSIRK-type signal peptide-containing protein [Lactobacillus gasseri]
MLFNKKDFDSKQRFSIRKLSVGVCSVLLSTLFLTFNEGQTVHASTDVNAADTTTTSVSSNTTNNSSDNNTDKKDDSKVEASSLATAEKHAPIPIAAEIKSNKSEDQTNSASAETATQVSKSKQAQSQTTINIVKATATQASTSSKDSSDTTSSKDNSAQNTVEKNRSTSTSKYTPVLTSETSVSTKTNQSNSNSATQEKSNIKPVTPHADSTEHIAPETYTMDSDTPAYVVAGSDLTNLASKFISNAAALIQSGATFSWVGNAPTATQQDAINGSTISGTIRVTYKDGTSTTKDIESYVEARSQLQPSTFYYVNRVNDTPDFNTADANGNDFSTMIVNQYAYDSTAFSYKILGTLDTSSLGIHWANVQVTDNNTFAGAPLAPTVIGDPYVIKVPYVVQGLKLRDDIPTDDNGNPVINAQLATMPKSTSATPTTPAVAFDPVQGEPSTNNAPAGLWGQYFYQDYALAYALGIKVQVAADEIDSAGHWKNKPTDLVNTKTNHFTVTFNNLSNATQQEVDVNYVSAPHAEDMYIYNAANKTYMTGRPANAQAIKDLLAAGYMNDKVWVTLADGTYYYEVNAKVNIAQKVNFEFVDEYNDNNVVGETYSQEFVPGVETNLKFHMAMPDGYELGNGASIPSQYTLAAFSQTTPVVQVPIHQKMHFYITFHDEDSNTNLGTVEVSGSAAAGTGGYYPSINTKLTFPAGADAGDYYSVSTSGVPDGVQLVGSYGVSLTNPTADWTTPNYQWENTFSVLKALTGATMTINLKHKIQETQEQQTRKPTVNYIKAKVNADGTYTPDGSAFTSAVLDVYYSRTKSKDLVTKKVTYTPWLWDTKQGQNGYHVESGTWTSLPQSWGAVVADVPTLDGYTAATVTDQSGQPANQFVYPTWNKAGTSDEGKESLAYTENAPIYEARPVHTVLYIPNETQTRTVTENYVYADAGDLTGEEVFSPYKLEIFYKKTGSLNVSTNTITYSGWSWDTDAGDSDTPGFHVISGQGNWTGLGSNGQPSGSSLGINVPTKDGYTAIISAYPAAIYSSTVFGNPGVNSGTGYTNDTDSTWYWRNSLTTYYVPNSKLSKTVTRTINITQPGKETETTVQKSTITRTAHLNVNDSGIAYNDWGTDSMYWYALNVPKVGGYTMTVTKTVNGVTTPIQLVNGQIPAETVNGTSQDTTINITWGAVATATLTGTGTSTYNGQAITNAELNNALKVNVTGPTAGAGMYTLQAGDVEFSTDGMNWTTALPINAGNYQVRLTAQGKNGIIAKYGNNSIIWTQNGQSTITSNATYMINKLADNAVMANAQSGNYEMTYNGAAPSTLDPSKFVFTTTVNGQTVTLDATGLNSSDFTWADGNAPVNVGTYKVVLTDAGLAKLNANNPNFDLTNSGNGTFTINQANASATLSGSASREYNGQAVSVDDLNSTSTGNNITLTLHYPKDGNANYSTTVKLNNGYFTWNTPNGQAPVNADSQPYTIVLNSDAIEGIIKQAVGNGQNDVSNVKFADNAISGSASFEITPSANTVSVSGTQTETYNGSPINVVYNADDTNSVKVSITQTSGNTTGAVASLADVTLDSGDFAIVNGPAENVGSYQVKLTAAGLAKIQNAVGDNYHISIDPNAFGTLVIKKYKASAVFSGDPSYTYTGTPVSADDYLGKYSIALNEPNNPTYNLVAGDIEFNVDGNWTSQAPVKVGTYQVRLSQSGWNHIKAINSDNVEWAATASAGKGSYTIDQAKVTADLSGNSSMIYNGSAVSTADLYANGSTIKVAINGTGIANLPKSFTLEAGDYTWSTSDNQSPVNVGNYTIKLTQAAINKIQSQIDQVVGAGNVVLTTTTDDGGSASFEIKQAVAANVQLYGGENTIYNGNPVSFDPTKTETANNFGFHNVENLTVPTFTASDFTWYDGQGNKLSSAPTNAGTYYLKLNTQGEKAFADANPNYTFEENGKSTISGEIPYVVTPAELTIGVSGSASKVFNDKNAEITQEQINNGDIKLVWGNSTTEPTDLGKFTLTPSDLEVVDANGKHAIHANAGIGADGQPVKGNPYKVQLTADAIKRIKQLSGAANYKISQSAKSGEYFIYEHKAELTLTGNQTTVYGTATPFSPSKYQLAFTNWLSTDLPVPNLTWKDNKLLNNDNDTGLTWTVGDLYVEGYPDGGVPTNVGTYQVELSEAGQEKLKALTGNQGANYKWAFNTNADYVVKAAAASAELSGSNQKTFDGTAVTTAEVNSNGQILVHFTFPGSTTQSTYALQNGDYTWSTANGNAPTNVGTYTISLNKQAILDHLQNALNTQAGLGDNDQSNVTVSADKLSGQASFKINPQTLTDVTISAPDQSKTYDAQAADLDVNGITITANGIVANNPLVNPGISASDFTWYDETGNKLESAPVDVGTYQARLNASTLAELQNANSNYQFSSVAGLINYTINPAPATAKISGSADRDYNAQTTSVSDVMNKIKWNTTGLVTNQDLNLTGLTANSYAWYSKDADGNYVAMTGNPVNAGTYYLRLTKDAIAQVKADNSNYNFTSVDGEFTYTINVVNGTATLRGSSSKTYDGQAATTAEVNSTNGDIIVSFAFPGSSAQSTYALQAGDYIWENKDGQEISAPTNAGTYTIKLSADGITNLQNAINQYAGQGNVTLDAQDLLGAAVYTIKQKALNVILGNNGTGTDGKTYDGQPAVINTQAENFGVFTTSGLVNGEDLNAANLTNDDYEWVDANGKAISAPTNAGTYYISLTANGLKKLQADNPNYAISESGQFTYVIRPAEENVTISGSQESTSTSIDNANFTVHAPAGITVPTGMTYEFATGVPSESGVYVIKLTPESIAALEKTNPNYKLNISSDARFTLDATLSIEFEDTQDGNKQVGKTITKTGVANSTINDLKLVVPDNYELAPDQELPTSYTFGKTLNQNLYIKLVHKLNELNPTDPSTNPHPTNKNWFRENGLVKDVTRTINYEGLSTAQLAQIPETQKAQTVEFTRTAKYDLVTGKIVVNSEGSWTAVDGKDIFAGFTPFAFAGYTAAPAKVEQVKVTGNDKNSQITVTYTANNQTGKISYVDSDGKEVGQTTISGKTGETVKVTPEAPTGWQIVSGQDIPETVVATPTGVPTVVVKVTHSTITVTPETPEKDIPTGPVSGDPSKNYEKMESITASPTRTIVVTDPSGRTTKVTQTVNFTRTATFDEVTGEITYSNWASSEPAEWSEYTAPEVAGYTATQMVKSQAVSAETKNETVSISYTANNQTGKISYVDSQGNEVGQTALTGKTDQSVAVTPEAPTGWIIVAGQDIPKSVTATATGIPTVTVRVEHSTTIVTPKTPEKDIPTGPVPGDPSKNYEKMESLTASPTRTIVVTDPSGKTTKVTQTVNFTRTATFDEVTGEITYSNWASSEPTEWSQYAAPEVAGYTATQMVKSQVVSAETADETIRISYTANTQTGKISYVDGDGKEVGQTTISGQTGETVNVTPQVPSGWKIVPGQDIPKTITISENGIPTVTVKVEHGTVIVTPDTPEKDIPTGPVPGDPSKNYEKMESLTATPTRTIVVTDPSGKTTKVTQTVNFTRTATFDEVTGRVTYSDWKLQNSNASNHAAQWDSYTPHVITHYVPSVAEVPAKVVNSHTANSQVEITYAPASESQVIRYVDQNGKEISTQIVSGKYGLDTTFTPKLPNNWQAANTIPTSIKIGENGGLTTIVIEAKTEKVQQSKTVTETIHYHTANGKQIVADKEMKVNFTRTGVKNLVTGEITWNSWNNAEEIFNEVPSPKVSGYTASPAKVAAQTVTPNSEDLVFNVIYTKNSQTYPTIPENKPNKPQEENVSKQETKTQDKLIHEYGYKKRADGRLVDHTGHVYPASSKVKENGAIYSEKGELLSVGSRRKHELPQTGLHDNSLIAAIGSLLAGISIFGLLGGREKKDDDK